MGMLSPYRKASEYVLNLRIKSSSKLEMILWLCKLRSLLNCPEALTLKQVEEIVDLIEKCSFAEIFL